jgi:hypothetical protein
MVPDRSITAYSAEPIVAVIVEEDGREMVRYFPEELVDAAISDDALQAALAAIGSSSDLDWDAWADELDRIRHESKPTPPIEL